MIGLPIFEVKEKLSLEEIKQRLKTEKYKKYLNEMFDAKKHFCYVIEDADTNTCDFVIQYSSFWWIEIAVLKENNALKTLILAHNNYDTDTDDDICRITHRYPKKNYNWDNLCEKWLEMVYDIIANVVFTLLNNKSVLKLTYSNSEIEINIPLEEKHTKKYKRWFKEYIKDYFAGERCESKHCDLSLIKDWTINSIMHTIGHAGDVAYHIKTPTKGIDADVLFCTDKGALALVPGDSCTGVITVWTEDSILQEMIGEKIISVTLEKYNIKYSEDYYPQVNAYHVETKNNYFIIEVSNSCVCGFDVEEFILTNSELEKSEIKKRTNKIVEID